MRHVEKTRMRNVPHHGRAECREFQIDVSNEFFASPDGTGAVGGKSETALEIHRCDDPFRGGRLQAEDDSGKRIECRVRRQIRLLGSNKYPRTAFHTLLRL